MSDKTGFRKGSRVYWHGLFPRKDMLGTLVEPGLATDLRQLVMWDGRTEPSWEHTTALMKVNAGCKCPRCAQKP